MKRRTFLGAGIATGALGILAARPAGAQSKQIVVMNWGGDWNDRTVKYVEAPLLEANGWKIVRELTETAPRLTKILSEKRLPRGTIDLAHIGDFEAYSLYSNDAIDTIDYARIPNAHTLMADLKQTYFMPWLCSPWEIVYKPERVLDPVTSYSDLWNPKYAGKVGVMDANYANAMQMASIIGAGKINDFAAAKKLLVEWKKAVNPRVYPSHQQAQAALQTDEIWMVANFRARGLQWANDGMKCEVAYPKEGGIYTVFGVVMPKRVINRDGAYVYLNALLDPGALAGLCAANFYSPTVTNVTIPGEVGAKIAVTGPQKTAMHYPDQKFWSENRMAWIEWWKKDFLSS